MFLSDVSVPLKLFPLPGQPHRFVYACSGKVRACKDGTGEDGVVEIGFAEIDLSEIVALKSAPLKSGTISGLVFRQLFQKLTPFDRTSRCVGLAMSVAP